MGRRRPDPELIILGIVFLTFAVMVTTLVIGAK